MPIGNGDVGMNVWVEDGGDLVFYISKMDSWSENGRLLKVGRIRVKLDPNPFTSGSPFRQELKLENGEIIINAGDPEKKINLRVWPDANHNVIHIEASGQQKFNMQAELETWRNEPHEPQKWERHDKIPRSTAIGDVFNVLPFDHPYDPGKLIVMPDSVLTDTKNEIIWFHHNRFSTWEIPMKQQGHDELMEKLTDPLLHRTFGGLIKGRNFISADSKILKSKKQASRHHLSIHVLTEHPVPPEKWISGIRKASKDYEKKGIESHRSAHADWWKDFWDRSYIIASGSPEAETITRSYILQRYMSACAGRGAMPIKFNGSIFTVEDPKWGAGDPDYRRWGPGYWFQNTRLPYWPMLASGDFEMMQPFFNMYRDALPVAIDRTKLWFGHGGAFFPETANFWGTYAADHYGWKRKGRTIDYLGVPQLRRYWQGGLELSAMMLSYYAHTGDDDFAQKTMLPVLESVLEFYDQHYERDKNGKLFICPAQACETWLECVNPMPVVAGLYRVTGDALKLSDHIVGAELKEKWTSLRTSLPEIPVRERIKYYNKISVAKTGKVTYQEEIFQLAEGKPALAPAEEFYVKSNVENPELYAVFPYRLYAVGRPDLDLAVNAFKNRIHPNNIGWQQHPMWAAYLGLADEAAELVYERATNTHKESRFPAMWGPNYDWIPDQDNGGVLLMGFQSMVLQNDGEKTVVLPAWPDEWNVEFRLHSINNTVVSGKYKDGKLLEIHSDPTVDEDNLMIMKTRAQ
jgi:hypothetical protein